MRRVWTIGAVILALAAPALADAAQGQSKGRGDSKGKPEKQWESRRDSKVKREPVRIWRRGQVLPPAYRGAVIADPHRYGLYAPPRGHAWVRVGDDVYLTAVGSGQIVEVLRDTL